MKAGDLVKFKNQKYFSFYGIGIVREHLWSSVKAGDTGWSILFGAEIIQAREGEMELISESR